jgi:hypothetical protein
MKRELAEALFGGADPASSTLSSRTARLPLYRMFPGFLGDPASMPGSDDGAADGDFLVNFGDDNPFFEPRHPADPGGVGYLRLFSQMQVLDTGSTSICVGMRAWTPAGLENGGAGEGHTYFAPSVGLFQELDDSTGLQAFVGQHFCAAMHGGNREASLNYGVALHYQVPWLGEETSSGVFLFVQALGRYGYQNLNEGRETELEVVPGIQWRLSENFWMSVGASRRGMFTCGWQF